MKMAAGIPAGIKEMTEAIASSQDLGDDARKDALEHLAVVSAEAAMPPEMRKMGPLNIHRCDKVQYWCDGAAPQHMAGA
jgi:hypothetical protein